MTPSEHAELRVRVEPLNTNDSDLDQVTAIALQIFSSSTCIDAREELARPFTHAWVARRRLVRGQTELLGFIITWHVADELHVLNVATHQPFRRQGVGRALMQQALEYARSHEVRLLVLEVRLSNEPAIQMYRSLGFYAIGRRPGYYTDNGEDALEMVLVLDPQTGHIVPGLDEVQL